MGYINTFANCKNSDLLKQLYIPSKCLQSYFSYGVFDGFEMLFKEENNFLQSSNNPCYHNWISFVSKSFVTSASDH